MAHSTFGSRFHSTFLSTSYAWERSLVLSVVSSLTLLGSILANDFHSPVKTRISFGLDRPVRRLRSMLPRR
jgi:hypothetical protein